MPTTLLPQGLQGAQHPLKQSKVLSEEKSTKESLCLQDRHTWCEDSFLTQGRYSLTHPCKAGQTSEVTHTAVSTPSCRSRAENTLSGLGLLGENTGYE